ncbi:MAG: asparagine synthase (glutamine-hydrolyzing) [Clostridiales bacterium]|nr:asparagine synthase (glutamine-hydrolyzing) [Clostridiales bacterium]
MSGFCGWLDFNKTLENRNEILFNMTDSLIVRNNDEKKYYQDDNINIGCKNLKDILSYKNNYLLEKICNNKKYVIAFSGEIYNSKELIKKFKTNGIHIEEESDTEVVLNSYILWKEKCANYLNGVFAFIVWDKDDNKIFMARDHFGVKPLFYTISNNVLVFASEIKALFEYPAVNPIINKDGICQLFGLGPARIEGKCVFKDIYEIKPASYMIYTKLMKKEIKYWDLKSHKHTDDIEETISNVKSLLNKSIIDRLVSEKNVGTMLSGGLDSSIISAVSSKEYEKKNKVLKTFSVDYIGNDVNFKASDFQPDSDNKYIEIMKEKYVLEHKDIKLDNEVLIKGLKEAVRGRDLPGMTDVDVSLLEFCKEIKKAVSVVLSGEFADEIFGGYPWFYREECLNSDTFPWSISLDTREKIINKKYKDINLKQYVDNIYNEFIKQVPICEEDTELDKKIKKLMYLNIHWFGATLIDRTDRMSMFAGINVRTPFTEYKLAEYVWNIPWEIKTILNREKGLLRKAYEDILPKEVDMRKKSPYPKTYSPEYTEKIKNILLEILNNENEPIHQLIDKEEVLNIIYNLDETFTRPWFGQLMTGPQFMAYLIQINIWLIEYNIKIEA